jgi:ribosomal-protein-alanine N-acetyltransferase
MKSTTVPLFKKSKRLVLRPLEIHDYENWAQAYSSMRPPQTEWDETNWVESELTKAKFKAKLKKELHYRSEDKYYSFGIFLKDDGLLIGQLDFADISRARFQNAYLGYRIFNSFWGHGFATEACDAALQLGFKDLKLHRIEAGISAQNKASIKVAKKIGLKKEGVSKKRVFVNNKWADLVLYAATCEDYGIKYKFPPKAK